ncbi:MAG: peptidylprolyl isomerase [Pseudomonadota bacterium]
MRLLKEPVFHFALLGIAIFVWFSATKPVSEPFETQTDIVVSQQTVATLALQLQAQLNRVPTLEEVAQLVERYIRDEILVREARALGLDQGDGVVRNRLVQKMEFLTVSAAQSVVPEDDVLEAHLQENAAKFALRPAISFDQFALDDAADAATVEAYLQALNDGQSPERTTLRLLPDTMDNSTPVQVDRVFGTGTFEALYALPVGDWVGPVRSGYGAHLVRLRARTDAVLPPLDEVRSAVLSDWQSSLSKDLSTRQYEALEERYSVTRPSQDQVKTWIDE